MAGVNKVIIVGNLGNDPDMRTMTNGEAVANISVATSEDWKDKQTGEKKSVTEWHRIVFYRKLAEIVGQYLKKGSKVYIEGKLKTRQWKDNNGVDRYTTEIIADSMQMLGDNNSSQQSAPPVQQQTAQHQTSTEQRTYNTTQPRATVLKDLPPIDDDEIPF